MPLSPSDRLEELRLKSEARLKQQQERAEQRLVANRQKFDQSKELADYRAAVSTQQRQERKEAEIRDQGDLTKLEHELTPEQLEFKYQHYVKTTDIDFQAFTQRENLVHFLERQADKEREQLRRQEVITALKAYLVEEEARRQTDTHRHQHDMEMERLRTELEIKAFKEKHEFLMKLHSEAGDLDKSKIAGMIEDLKVEAPNEAIKTAKPENPIEPE